MKRITFFVLCFLLTACGSAGIWLANAPVDFTKDQTFLSIPYGAPGNQKLDIYSPAAQNEGALKSKDVIVFFYGGRWTTGSKEYYKFVAESFARRGYIVVIPDYRKYPKVKFPVFVQDGAQALSWTDANIKRYGGNPDRIFLAGHSAGAHIAALIVTDERYLRRAGLQPSIVKAFAGLAGPYSFEPEDADLKDMFGPPENYSNMKADNFIDGEEAPMLLLHGGEDTDVGQFNMDRLAQAIQKKGGKVSRKIYPGLDHIEIIAALSWIKRDEAPVAHDIDSFFRAIP